MLESRDISRRALSLSLAIYRVTANFPNGEILTRQLRLLANQIAGDITADDLIGIEKKVNRLLAYFKVAKAQNWVKPINWSILDFEYYKLQREVVFELAEGDNRGLTRMENTADKRREQDDNNIMSHNIKKAVRPAGRKPAQSPHANVNPRKSKILAVLNKKESLKMSDLIPLFKDEISERTLRNELQNMVESGLIKKNGVNKFTEYYKS